MHRWSLVLVLLATLAAIGVRAQSPLKLSQTLLAIKVTDPLKQLAAFAPVIDMVAGVAEQSGLADDINIQSFRDTITRTTAMPGVNAKGDFWFAVLQPARDYHLSGSATGQNTWRVTPVLRADDLYLHHGEGGNGESRGGSPGTITM